MINVFNKFKFFSTMFDEKVKYSNLSTKTDIGNLIKKTYFEEKLRKT